MIYGDRDIYRLSEYGGMDWYWSSIPYTLTVHHHVTLHLHSDPLPFQPKNLWLLQMWKVPMSVT